MDSKTGLTTSEALSRAASGQSNNGSGAEIKTKSYARIVCENVFTFFNLINTVLAIMVIAVGSFRNALFMGVVICNTLIGIIQSIRAKRAIDKLSIISAPKACVIRDGAEKNIAVGGVVLDDVLVLSAGAQVCADCLVLEGECEADESLLTGESDAVFKRAGGELFSGSFIVSGRVTARVIRVGKDSVSGRITSGSKYLKKTHSDMMRSINIIIKTVSLCIFPFGAILLYKSLSMMTPFKEAVTSTTAALIGMIPEGLVLLTGIALAISAVRLARNDTLCRDLYCVEALARADVLCLDKTGTLTEGRMEVAETVLLNGEYDDKALKDALSAFISAFPERNSTLKALAEFFGSLEHHTLIKTIPFSSARKWSLAEFEGLGTLVLGAPEVLIGNNLRIVKKCAEYSKNGMRTLVFARSPMPLPTNSQNTNYSWELSPDYFKDLQAIAVIVLSDRLRPSAGTSVEYFKRQGVDVKVISGDDPAAVSRIAERAGLDGARCLVDMSRISDDEIQNIVERYTVFGRTTPDQKLKLIKALKNRGHKTAMIGDGVNDVLALRESDCSIAIGAAESGSDAVRAVSQIVLMNSDFSSLPLVVQEGRRCINNIRRSASLFLTKTIFSFLLSAVFLFLPLNYPFKPIQLTLISAVWIGIPSFLLALEANTDRISNAFTAHIFKHSAAGGISAAFGVILLTAVRDLWSISEEAASTMGVFITAAAFFGTLFHICRPFNKRRAILLIAAAVLFSGTALMFPVVFYLTELNTVQTAVLSALSVIVVALQAGLRVIFNKIRLKD